MFGGAISYNTAIVLMGAGLLGANAGLVGSFAVLRRRSLMGDALAHASLPGLCLAFLALGERSLPAMQLGALVTGVLGVLIVAGLRRVGRIKEDAAIGIVLSVFFGVGVVLVRIIQNQTATGSKAGLDSYIYGKTAGMIASDVMFIAGVSLFCLVVVTLLFKEFGVESFDPAFARAQGWPTVALDILLTTLIAVTVVIGLPAVGVVLMAALLILPAAAARFWTDRLGHMVVIATALGLLTGTVGTGISARYSGLPAGPVIVLVGSALFAASMLFAPRRGAIARIVGQRRVRRRVAEQRLLRMLYDVRDEKGLIAGDDLARRHGLSSAEARHWIATAARRGFVQVAASGQARLTGEGLRRGEIVSITYQRLRQLLVDDPRRGVDMATLDLEAEPAP